MDVWPCAQRLSCVARWSRVCGSGWRWRQREKKKRSARWLCGLWGTPVVRDAAAAEPALRGEACTVPRRRAG